MIKKLTTCVLVLATLVLFTACEVPDIDTDTDEDTLEEASNYDVVDFRDPETGVHYLIYTNGAQGGITVRYRSDGLIMVD